MWYFLFVTQARVLFTGLLYWRMRNLHALLPNHSPKHSPDPSPNHSPIQSITSSSSERVCYLLPGACFLILRRRAGGTRHLPPPRCTTRSCTRSSGGWPVRPCARASARPCVVVAKAFNNRGRGGRSCGCTSALVRWRMCACVGVCLCNAHLHACITPGHRRAR